MSRQPPLSLEQRRTALTDIRGDDRGRVVEAAKVLSSDPSTTPDLVGLLATETRADVRQGVLYALAWHADLGTWELMIRILSDAAEAPNVRGQAAEGLSYMFHKVTADSEKFEAAVSALLVALKDPSPEVRYCAVNALGATRHQPLIPVLERMVEDKTPVPGWLGTVGDEARRALEWINWPSKRP